VHTLSKYLAAILTLQAPEGDLKQIPHWRPTNIRRHLTNFSGPGNLVLRVFVPL